MPFYSVNPEQLPYPVSVFAFGNAEWKPHFTHELATETTANPDLKDGIQI